MRSAESTWPKSHLCEAERSDEPTPCREVAWPVERMAEDVPDDVQRHPERRKQRAHRVPELVKAEVREPRLAEPARNTRVSQSPSHGRPSQVVTTSPQRSCQASPAARPLA